MKSNETNIVLLYLGQ